MSDEHFTVDGTLLEACASLKSFQKVGDQPGPSPDDPGNPRVDFHGESRSNKTHESTTDGDALLARKGSGKEAKLTYSGPDQWQSTTTSIHFGFFRAVRSRDRVLSGKPNIRTYTRAARDEKTRPWAA
jgi:hypothetical protein